MKKFFILYWIILNFFTWDISYAEERVEQTVVVTASRFEESQKTVPQSMTVIDSETLAKNQYESLASLLQNYGFDIMTYGPNQTVSQINMRGFESNYSNPFESKVLLLLNGAPIATTNLSMIPMDGIKQIEILRGPGAVQYGSSAIGGVINIIPRQGGAEFHLSAEGGGGSWQSWRALGSLSGELKFFDFAGAVNMNGQDKNYTTGSGDLYSDTEVKQRMGYLLNFGININEENRIGAVVAGAYDWGLGMNDSLSIEESSGSSENKMKMINSSLSATYTGGYSEVGLNWKFRYFNAYQQSDYIYANLPDSEIYITQQGGQGQISWNRDFLTLTGGIDYSDNKYSSGYAPHYKQTDTAAFGMLKLSFLEEMLTITGGIRYDSYTFEVNGNEQNLDNVTLSAGLAVNPFEYLTFRASLGESYLAPSGLAVVGYDGPYGVTGNPDLKPEKGLGWDTGIDVRWQGLDVSLTYFATNYRDKITSTYLPTGKQFYYNADGSIFYNGFEGLISIDLGELFEWDFVLRPYFNFTKMFSYNNTDGDKLYNIRDFVAGYGVNFSYPELGTDLDLRFNYLGYQKELAFDANYIASKRREGGKTVMDIFLSQKIFELEEGGKFTIKAEVRNLTNEEYSYRYDYPMPGRSFYVGLRYDY